MLDYFYKGCSLAIVFSLLFSSFCMCVCIHLCIMFAHVWTHTHVSAVAHNWHQVVFFICFCLVCFLPCLLSRVFHLNWFSHSNQPACSWHPLSQFPKHWHYRKATVPTQYLYKCWGPKLQSSFLCDTMLYNEPSPHPPILFPAVFKSFGRVDIPPKLVYTHNTKWTLF